MSTKVSIRKVDGLPEDRMQATEVLYIILNHRRSERINIEGRIGIIDQVVMESPTATGICFGLAGWPWGSIPSITLAAFLLAVPFSDLVYFLVNRNRMYYQLRLMRQDMEEDERRMNGN